MTNNNREKSPPTNHGEGKEESLTTLLNEDQRGELTLLIASVAAVMRKTIISSFDASAGISKDLVQELTTSEDDKITNPNIDPGTVDVAKMDAERKLKEQREKELSAPAMKELKQASLKFFDEWRTSVILRVGEVVNSKEKASSHMRSSKAPDAATHAR